MSFEPGEWMPGVSNRGRRRVGFSMEFVRRDS